MLIWALLLLLTVYMYVGLSPTLSDNTRVLYGLVLAYHNGGFYILWITAASLFVWLVVVLPRISRYDIRRRLVSFVSGLLLSMTVPLICCNLWLAELGTEFTHTSQLRIDDNLYQLAFKFNDDKGASYNIYRCDSIGFVCDRVHQIDLTDEMYRWRVEELQAARTATLIGDPTARTLSIQVNGETIYTLSI
jgi:hypothetical protein